MMGRTHVFSGFAAGAALLPLAPTDGTVATALGWVTVTGGAALLPDLDHPQATVTRMWGPLSSGPARVLRWLARGHRAGTHDVLVAPAVFGLVARAAASHPVTAGVLVAFIVGVALRGVEFVLPGRTFETAVVNLLASAAAAVAVVHYAVEVAWLPWALALGVVVHIAGDAATKSGIPIPFTWLDGRSSSTPGGLLTTGRWYETWLIAPALLAATGVLLWLHLHHHIPTQQITALIGDLP